jgi:hypothetical protein
MISVEFLRNNDVTCLCQDVYYISEFPLVIQSRIYINRENKLTSYPKREHFYIFDCLNHESHQGEDLVYHLPEG